jgi:hypothetical protein
MSLRGIIFKLIIKDSEMVPRIINKSNGMTLSWRDDISIPPQGE